MMGCRVQKKKVVMSSRRFDPVLYAALVGAVLVLSACNTVPATQTPETAVYVHHIYRPAPQPPAPLSPLDDPNSVLARRSVYFGVNAAEVREADRSLLRAHAEFMRANPSARLRIEGNADDRGGTHSNRLLAQRRADNVRQFMLQAGVAPMALEAISYGKDNPVDPAATEEARARNRRAELKYLAR